MGANVILGYKCVWQYCLQTFKDPGLIYSLSINLKTYPLKCLAMKV